MSAVEEDLVLDTPGVYSIPPHLYHQDPVPGGSLSSTVARQIVEPGGPAAYKYGEDQRTASKDFGSLAHLKLLGIGDRIRLIDADSFRTNAAKAERDAAYEAREIPILKDHDDLARADAMVEAAMREPIVAQLLSGGAPEQTVVWQEQGQWCRALVDYLDLGEQPIHVDYKTTTDASPGAFAKAVTDYGYHQQADWYLRGLRAVGRATEDTPFLLIVQEKKKPYRVNVFNPLLDYDLARIAKAKNDAALATWRECRETDEWPSYPIEPQRALPAPVFYLNQNEEYL